MRWDRYDTYEEVTRILHLLEENRPDLVTLESAGRTTVLDWDIWGGDPDESGDRSSGIEAWILELLDTRAIYIIPHPDPPPGRVGEFALKLSTLPISCMRRVVVVQCKT